MMINKDFSHPIVKIVYDKIGSWKLSNGTEKEIKQKVEEIYPQAIIEFKNNPSECWDALNAHKAQLALEAPIPDKIPSSFERMSFNQRMEEYLKKANEEKAAHGESFIPEFDPKKTNKDGEQYQDYCKYLFSIPDHHALTLPSRYAYDRIRLRTKAETENHLHESGYIPDNLRQHSERRTKSKGPTKDYKAWMND